MSEEIVCVSGYFDPIHIGHLQYLQKAKQLVGPNGKLVVIVNNDLQATLKKGKPFMPCKERCEILRNIKYVDVVVESIDMDRTVCATLESLEPKPTIFANGGDQFNHTIPEVAICEKYNIKLVDGLGDKIQSSSWLIKGSKN